MNHLLTWPGCLFIQSFIHPSIYSFTTYALVSDYMPVIILNSRDAKVNLGDLTSEEFTIWWWHHLKNGN